MEPTVDLLFRLPSLLIGGIQSFAETDANRDQGQISTPNRPLNETTLKQAEIADWVADGRDT